MTTLSPGACPFQGRGARATTPGGAAEPAQPCDPGGLTPPYGAITGRYVTVGEAGLKDIAYGLCHQTDKVGRWLRTPDDEYMSQARATPLQAMQPPVPTRQGKISVAGLDIQLSKKCRAIEAVGTRVAALFGQVGDR